jgi:tetratricopeptide (TPR) repeat protein
LKPRIDFIRCFFTCCLLLTAAGQPGLPQQQQQQLPSLDEMRRMLPQLNEHIKGNPNDAKSLCGRGFINQQLGNFSNCIEDCTQAITADPSLVEAYNYRFIAYMQTKNYPQALKDASEVIRLKGNAAAYCNRAAVYQAMHQYATAIPDLTKAIQLDKTFPQAYNNLGDIAYRTAKYDQSIAYCNRALYLDPHMSESLYFRGKSYEALGKKALAQKDLESARSAGYRPNEPFIQIAK